MVSRLVEYQLVPFVEYGFYVNGKQLKNGMRVERWSVGAAIKHSSLFN